MNRSSWRRLCALLVVLALTVAACGGGEDEVTATDPPEDAAEATDPTEDATDETTESETEATEEVKDEATVDVASPTPTPEPATAPPTPDPATEPEGGLVGEPREDIGDQMGVGGQTTYAEYTTITDDTGAIQVEVPAEWSQVDGRPFNDDQGRELFDVRAAPDLEGFNSTWDVPGIIITASTDLAQSANEITLLDELVDPFGEVCTYLGRQPYDDGLYTGQADVFENCGGTETGYLILGAVPTSRAFVIRLQVQVVDERDLEALGRALASFVIVGDV